VLGMVSVGVVGLPLAVSALVVVALRRARPSIVYYVTMAGAGLTALCALTLGWLTSASPHAGGPPSITVEWLPGAGPMGLATDASGLYAALATTCGAFLVLLSTTSRSAEYPTLARAVTLLALAATNAAFLADHFLARYVALEVVALCIVLSPLVEMRDGCYSRSAGIRQARSSYLLLRLGDAGLLAAILILGDASGTLSIGPSLAFALSSIEEAGGALDVVRLAWVVAGFVLAVWVKLGGWPFHLWSHAGRRLSLVSQAWLYATVMPNLGAYLLYRVTPLLSLIGPLQTVALWLGAGGAALATLVALTQADQRGALVYVGAAQGGLALFVAAAGVKPAVWLWILALTPVRLLLFLVTPDPKGFPKPLGSRSAACLFARMLAFRLGGLALAAFGLLTTWWAREAGAPLDALFIAEAAVALTGIWAVRAARRDPKGFPKPFGSRAWPRWMTVGLLAGGVLAAGLTLRPLARHLADASGVALLAVPALPTLLRYAATAPAPLVVMALALALRQLQRRSGLGPIVSAEAVYDLEEGLARAAQVLHAVIEVGIAERIIALVVRTVVNGVRAAWALEHKGLEAVISRSAQTVVNGAHVAHRVVEQEGLEAIMSRSAQTVVNGAHVAYRVVEQEGLEGVLRRAVRTVLVLGRGLQRWHTGRLRRNLLWVPIGLALAVLALLVYGW